MVFAGGNDFDVFSKWNKLKKENKTMMKDLIMFTLKSLILAAIVTIVLHFIITNYQVQIFDANSGIIKNYIEVIRM